MTVEVTRLEKQGQGSFGGMNHYDDRGRKTGHSDRNFLGDWNHYDD